MDSKKWKVFKWMAIVVTVFGVCMFLNAFRYTGRGFKSGRYLNLKYENNKEFSIDEIYNEVVKKTGGKEEQLFLGGMDLQGASRTARFSYGWSKNNSKYAGWAVCQKGQWVMRMRIVRRHTIIIHDVYDLYIDGDRFFLQKIANKERLDRHADMIPLKNVARGLSEDSLKEWFNTDLNSKDFDSIYMEIDDAFQINNDYMEMYEKKLMLDEDGVREERVPLKPVEREEFILKISTRKKFNKEYYRMVFKREQE